jgi:hypothetical protein
MSFFTLLRSILILAPVFVLLSAPRGLASESTLDAPSVSTVDLGASRRALRASMNDWQDDERTHGPTRRWLCLNAMMSAEGSPLIFPSNHLLWELPRFFSNRQGAPRGAAPTPLRERIRRLIESRELTLLEREGLQRIESRTLEDRLDQIRWVIDLQAELMAISNRLYTKRWNELNRHARENPTFLTGADDPVSLCLAAQVRTERNLQLLRAAERILALFDFLELEQDREFGGGGSGMPVRP